MPPLTDQSPSKAEQAPAKPSSFSMPSPIQWDTVVDILANNPPGTKLHKKNLYRDVELEHSFIEISNQLIAMPSSDQPGIKLGEGNFGAVKKVFLRHSNREHVVKIGTDHETFTREALFAQDLNYSLGMTRRHGSDKLYLHMFNLGKNLTNVLSSLEAKDHNRRMNLGIEIILQYIALHSGKLSKTHTPIAHFDAKPDNIAVQTRKHNKDTPNLLDMGCTKKYPSKLRSLTLGTYWYRPIPMSLLLNGIELDSFALERILFFPTRFLSADGYTNLGTMSFTSVFTPEMMSIYGLHEHINTSIRYLNTPASFYEHRTTPLALAALLITTKNHISFHYNELKKDPWSCLLLIKAHEKGLSSQQITQVLSKPFHLVKSSLPIRFRHLNHSMIRALFICSEIAPKVDLDQLATNPLAPTCVQKAADLELLPHLHLILNDPKLIFMLCQTHLHPDFGRVLKIILDESPEDKNTFRNQRIQWLYQHYTKIPEAYNRHIEKALRITEKHKLPYTFEELMDDQELAIIIYKLAPFKLLPFLSAILQIPALCNLITQAKIHHHFFSLLKEVFNGENIFADPTAWQDYIYLLRAIPDVLEIADRRKAYFLEQGLYLNLTSEQLKFIRAYDKLMIENYKYSYYLERLLTAPDLCPNDRYIGIKAANAVLQSRCNYQDKWISRIASGSRAQAGQIYIEAVLHLKKQGADSLCFNNLFAQLESSIDDLEGLKIKLILLKQGLLTPANVSSCISHLEFRALIATFDHFKLERFIPLLFSHHELLPILSSLISNTEAQSMAFIPPFLTAFEELSITNRDSIQPEDCWVYSINKAINAQIPDAIIYKIILMDPIYCLFAHFIENNDQACEYLLLAKHLAHIKQLAEQHKLPTAQYFYNLIQSSIHNSISARKINQDAQGLNSSLCYKSIHKEMLQTLIPETAFLQKGDKLDHYLNLFIDQSAKCAQLNQQPPSSLEKYSIFSPKPTVPLHPIQAGLSLPHPFC